MGIALDHNHGLMAADPLDCWQVYTGLDKVSNSRVAKGVTNDLFRMADSIGQRNTS